MDKPKYRKLNSSTSSKFARFSKLPQEPDRSLYTQELKKCSPIRESESPLITATIPFNLGKSEKFLEKSKVLESFRALGFIKSSLPIVKNPSKVKRTNNDSLSLLSSPGYSHLIYRKVTTPFSSGVVRIKSQSRIKSLSKTPSRNFSQSRISFLVRKNYEEDCLESEKKIENGFVEKVYENGDWYKGHLRNFKRHGKGIFYVSGHQLQITGNFYKNKLDGPAILEFSFGYVLEGLFNEGILEDSSASITYSNKTLFQGEIKEGQREGSGTQLYPSLTTFKGIWKSDQRSGPGLLLTPDQMLFEGNFISDHTEGPGVLVFFKTFSESSTSDFYPNLFKSDFFPGFENFPFFDSSPISNLDLVFMTLSKSSRFLPQYEKGFKDGSFVAGKLQGAGHARYGHVGEYFGEFFDGKRHGYGMMKFSDPEHVCRWFPETEGVYLGQWREDKRHGFGVMAWNNGTQYKGMWANDRRHGVTGKVIFSNGDYYEGGFVNENMLRSNSIKKINI
jgi:hypothetical protein